MSIVALVVFSVLVLGTSLWVVNVAWWSSGEVEDVLERLDSKLAPRLYGLVAPRLGVNDRELYAAIGGTAGLRRMHRDTGAFLTVAVLMRRKFPGDATHASSEIIRNALYLRLMTWPALFEAVVARYVPALPRVQARSCALLYCDISASLDVILSICEIGEAGRI